MPYGWNPAKNASNLEKHGVGFEAVQDLDWATSLVQADMRNSLVEVRLIALGVIGTQVHVLVFTIRRNATWIISLRRANRKEAARYASQA